MSTAILLSGAAPNIAAKPGILPSTNCIPSCLKIVSEKKPMQSGCGSCLYRYLKPTIISSARSVAIPESKASPKYGSQRDSVGSLCKSDFAS